METLNKGFKTTLLVLFMLFGVANANAHFGVDNYSSLVIVKVKGLNGSSFNKIAAGINKESSLSMEYSCLESDVIVIKYKHNFNEKGDVQHFINSKFKKWVGTIKVEFIHIDMVLGGSSKC